MKGKEPKMASHIWIEKRINFSLNSNTHHFSFLDCWLSINIEFSFVHKTTRRKKSQIWINLFQPLHSQIIYCI